ncbi:chemotaxis protein [Helicobacter turcicus]|uniref:Chemotaxis protein n=1 Tax=Helicobacter turcicus TaxID=2867412 RepID=A0ABS7JNX2_9HELI|nr:chemotaxis protein [Helicobacter turcicus]MBX7491111.1 chemotaxis protein [Helicobacter turcicus]MBX7545975.1 chemotaxis protein [Helicobacter turcicus]
MTQEELDALLNSDIEDVAEDTEATKTQSDEEPSGHSDPTIESGVVTADDFKISHEASWPPPPPTTEHKVVHQLDDVTRDSEIKATEMFDKLENINNLGADIEDSFRKVQNFINSQEELLQKLHTKFPNFHTFDEKLEEIASIKESAQKISDALQEISTASLDAMESMQYQDIHRQKIERVINVMRALSRYMSSLFEGKIEDNKRVSSAVYIQGDSADNVMHTDDIEALIEKFGSN